MKLFTIFVFLASFESTKSDLNIIDKDEFVLSHALTAVALEIFHGKFSNIRIICTVSLEVKLKTDDIVTNLIKVLKSNLKVSIWELKALTKIPNKSGSFVIIFINSLDTFELLSEKILYSSGQFEKFYLLVLVNGTFNGLNKIIETFWKLWIYNINVICKERDGTISLSTFYPYTNKSCGNNTNLQVVNRFDPKTLKWSTVNFYSDKFKNLHKCKINVGALKSFPPSAIVEKSKNETKISGFEVDIFTEMSKIYNLNCSFEDFENIGVISKNSSNNTDMLQSVYDGKLDVALGGLSLQFERLIFLSETRSFLPVSIRIVVPQPKAISSYQKLYMPFVSIVWIIIILIFMAAFLIVFGLKLMNGKFYAFLVGRIIQTPILNMINTFFGGSLHRLPSRNFARYILMNFMLFCLVIRSLYQAKLFIMLQTDLKEKTLNTIDEIIENQMSFYAYESLYRRIQEMKFASR